MPEGGGEEGIEVADDNGGVCGVVMMSVAQGLWYHNETKTE